MGRVVAGWVKGVLVVLVPLFVVVACDEPPPNPLASLGGDTGQQAQGGVGGGIVAGTGGRPSPAPVVSPATALAIETAPVRAWAPVPCPGGPCAAPNVCVNLDFLFVACVPCGGEDQICCPEHATATGLSSEVCDPGLACGANPNFQSTPPLDLVRNVCQRPGAPPPASRGLNHQRARFGL